MNKTVHVMAKPVGPICNLDCKYCFYLEKQAMFPGNTRYVMRDDVLEAYIRQQIANAAGPHVQFAWQGGEPTGLGLPYFENVVALQNRFAGGKTIENVLQTNAVLLDSKWAKFLAKHNFLVGVSIDGPPQMHDAYRVDKRGRPTSARVLEGVSLLKEHDVAFNTLTVVHRENARHPLEVYDFLKEIGARHLQFIPLVERVDDARPQRFGPAIAEPPNAGGAGESHAVAEWSVRADQYGDFLISIFDEWVRKDVGSVFVQLFEVALGNWMGLGSALCLFAETCGRAVALEHNGDLYACDHYVYPRYRLGNLLDTSLAEMANSPAQQAFGEAKRSTLPQQCRQCEVRFACNGECPRNRFISTAEGEPGLNYLCTGYRRFFNHIDPCMKMMARLLQARRPAADIMRLLAERDRRVNGIGA